MGIDYLNCKNCAEGFPDVIDYVCCECGVDWCSEECAEEDGYKKESCSKGYDVDDNDCEQSCWNCEFQVKASCKYCREEDFEDSKLLEFALGRLGVTRQRLVEIYKENK